MDTKSDLFDLNYHLRTSINRNQQALSIQLTYTSSQLTTQAKNWSISP